jgi:hypothetical protein
MSSLLPTDVLLIPSFVTARSHRWLLVLTRWGCFPDEYAVFPKSLKSRIRN